MSFAVKFSCGGSLILTAWYSVIESPRPARYMLVLENVSFQTRQKHAECFGGKSWAWRESTGNHIFDGWLS